MQISQLSPNSLTTSSPNVNPFSRTTETQAGATLQNNQDAQKPVRSTQTDTVTISQQALQMTGSNSRADESKAREADQAQQQQVQQQQQQVQQQQQQQQQRGSFSVQG